MAEYRTDGAGDRVMVEKRGGAGRVIGALIVLALLIAAVLFMTGFWRVNATGGALPKVDVSAKGGALPKVDMDSKRIVVGTTNATVEVPKVETKKEKIAVPVIGVTEGKTDKDGK